MKNRSRLTIFTTILSVLACFGLAFGNGGPESPDPSPFPVNSNTADGYRALENSGNNFNAAFGWFSLFNDTDALFNSGFGAGTLFFNNGTANTAVGTAALFFNTTGVDNTAVGINALRDNDSGGDNNAVGAFALFSNVGGFFNNAVGRNALTNSTGDENNAMGDDAMFSNTTGSFNTAVGDDALDNNVDGNSNVAIGDEAGTGLGQASVTASRSAHLVQALLLSLITPASSAASSVSRLAIPAAKCQCLSINLTWWASSTRRPGSSNMTFNRWTRPVKRYTSSSQ